MSVDTKEIAISPSPVGSPFEAFRKVQLQQLPQSEIARQYCEEQTGLNLMSEYWSFDSDEVRNGLIQNPKIVEDLKTQLAATKDDKEIAKILTELRKYYRKLTFIAVRKGTRLDEATGEMKEASLVLFFDPYTNQSVEMGQAVIVGKFLDLVRDSVNMGYALEGQKFWIKYLGNQKNKKNAFKSDRFDIIPIFETPE